MKMSYVLQNKNELKNMMFFIFADLFNVWLNRKQLISASGFNLLWYVVLVPIYEENLGPH